MNTPLSSIKRLFAALAATVALAMSTGASADPIGGPNSPCGSCQGATYWLTYSGSPLSDSDPLHETFRIYFTIDTSTYTGGGVAIDSAAIKVSTQNNLIGASLFAAPGGTSNWNLVMGGINANGCQTNDNNGFLCANYTGSGPGTPVGGFLQWVFDVTVNNGTLLDDASIKVRYVNSDGNKVGDLVSEEIELQTGRPPNEVPEPQTLALIGLGLLGLALSRRRRTR